MEPVHGGRDDVFALASASTEMMPQWSPSTEDGTTGGGGTGVFEMP